MGVVLIVVKFFVCIVFEVDFYDIERVGIYDVYVWKLVVGIELVIVFGSVVVIVFVVVWGVCFVCCIFCIFYNVNC